MTRSLAQSLAGRPPLEWARDFLVAARFGVTPENARLVISWEVAESGGGGGMYNPLNTTQGGYAGETDLNSVGVKNYVRWEDGIAANAKVIHNGFYPEVVRAFERGDNAYLTALAIIRSPWGTKHLPLLGSPPGPPKPPPPPLKGERMPSFPSAAKGANKFRGARVNLDKRTIELEGGAKLVPPEHPVNPNPWGGAYPTPGVPHGFTIWTENDLDEYHYVLP